MSKLSRLEQSLLYGMLGKIILMVADILFGRPTVVQAGGMPAIA